jgi:beta-lactam-binding protein with PASTA domain
MPNLIGHSRVQVYRIMRADGLYFQTRGPGSVNDRWAAVTAQSPRPGVVIAWHAQATLIVTTQSPRGPRTVPRLTGLTRSGVYAAMRHAQLYFKTVGPGSSNSTWTVALGQSPAPGTRVRWHDEITIRVSTHRPVAAVKKGAPVKATAVVINGSSF